ncbi:hypothetical protein F5887DRAFT_1077645 [Amanita rubescens]|nr:hypothetical protein F5887DRAFT_1083853 [Amanita rubescens]KAF8338559.1 hypothetical protein F5887DRAFT_1077645 [Amanita rubescens]
MAGPSHTSSHGSSKGKKKKSQPPASSDPSINLRTLAQRTLEAYRGYITKGKEFLALMVKARRENQEKDEIDTDLLEKAFDNPPNRFSAKALELFLVHKCLGADGCGPSTAE